MSIAAIMKQYGIDLIGYNGTGFDNFESFNPSPQPGDVYKAYCLSKYRPVVIIGNKDNRYQVVPFSTQRSKDEINVNIKQKHNPFLEKNSIAVVSSLQPVWELKRKLGTLRSKDFNKIKMSLCSMIGFIDWID